MSEFLQPSIFVIQNENKRPDLIRISIERIGIRADDVAIIGNQNDFDRLKQNPSLISPNQKLVIIDLDFEDGDMSGINTLEQIRIENKTIPVIALTTNVDSDDVKKAWAVGANIVIPAPYKMDDFNRIVSIFLGIQT